MTHSELLTLIRDTLSEVSPGIAPDADPDAGLKHELEVDSLSVLELVARLEYATGVAVPDEDWGSMTSMNAIAAYFAERAPVPS